MATLYTHTIGTTYKTDAGTVASPVATYTGHGQEGFNGLIAPSTTNQEEDLSFSHTAIWAVCLFSTGALTIKTNSATTPIDTVTLAAGQALIWAHDSVAACPFLADVTKLFITNASSTVTATLKIEILLNI